MQIALADWLFEVDVEATSRYTTHCTADHCLCAYCRNFYETVDGEYPALRPFLGRFGVNLYGPSELMPFEPTLFMACYRITGKIIKKGVQRMHVCGVPVRPEEADSETFFLWIGEMELPWVQDEPEEDVVSPANQPEFMERMLQKWLETRENDELS